LWAAAGKHRAKRILADAPALAAEQGQPIADFPTMFNGVSTKLTTGPTASFARAWTYHAHWSQAVDTQRACDSSFQTGPEFACYCNEKPNPKDRAMKLRLSQVLLATSMACLASTSFAAPVTVVDYSMANGSGQASGGSFNYWDRNYSGSGSTTTDGAALSGGLGKLTDGIISTSQWNLVSNNAGTGEYVGWWVNTTPSPTVTFNFGASVSIDSISIQLDNSGVGGVFAPTSILIDGVSQSFTAPSLGTVGSVVFGGLGLTGSSHTVQFVQRPGTWTFVSEVSFDNGTGRVPEPGSLALAGLALAGLLMTGKWRS
jgi:hypothetical protein